MTKIDLDGPADTQMMGIVHRALRRDLTRARAVLDAELAPTPDQRAALGEHLVWMMTFLDRHHTSEDAGLYPLVRRRDPQAAALLDVMDADHQAIHPAMDELRRTAGAFASGGVDAEDLLGAIDALEGPLLPHLEREEREMMPMVARAITEREWQDWDQSHNVKPLGPRELAFTGLWVMDGQPAADVAKVGSLIPAVPRWIITHLVAPFYRRAAFRRFRLPEHSDLRVALAGRTEVLVDARPDQVWAVLSDVTRTGEWSHECHEVSWLGGAPGALTVGARFRGRNRAGLVRWSRPCTVTELDPARRLAWHTDGGWLGDCSEWVYDLTPAGNGTRVVQQYRILSLPRWFERLIWRLVPAHRDRTAALRGDLVRLGEVAAREPITSIEESAACR